MTARFDTELTLDHDGFLISLEKPRIPGFLDYDATPAEDMSSVALVTVGENTCRCKTLAELRSAIRQYRVPIATFCRENCYGMAWIITVLGGLPRPIHDDPLYEGVAVEIGKSLLELAPAVVGNELVWHEMIPRDLNCQRLAPRRRVSIDTLEFAE